MITRKHILMASMLAGACVPYGAQSANWLGKGEAGVVIASGNTNTKTGNGKLDLTYDATRWKIAFGGTFVYASDDTGTTGQRWEVHGQHEHKFTPKTFWYNSGRYEDDRFSGFFYQATLGTGLGYRFFDTPATKFSVQGGVGYRMSESRDSLAADGVTVIPGENKREAILQAGADYQHDLTATTKIIEKFLGEMGSDNIYLQNDLSLQVRVTQVLALAVGYSVRHNTKPPEGFNNTDTLTTLNLVYEFK